VPTKTSILLLHGFQKKTQKTPSKEIQIAFQRYYLTKFDI
jgi:phage-related protein